MVRVTVSNGIIIVNYVPEEQIKSIENYDLLNPNPVSYSELSANISELKILNFCQENNCNLKQIIPYRFFANNELFRPLLRNREYISFIENYQKVYKYGQNSNLLNIYIDIEKLFSLHGDQRMCSLAIAIIQVN